VGGGGLSRQKQTKIGCAISLNVNSKICLDFNSVGYLGLRHP